MQKLTGKSLDI